VPHSRVQVPKAGLSGDDAKAAKASLAKINVHFKERTIKAAKTRQTNLAARATQVKPAS
jgi:hypothetical protein